MKHSIEAKPGEVNIKIEDVAGEQDRVLSALQECAEGRCSCPTPQYAKLDGIEIQPQADSISVRLQPKPGATLDLGDLERCLAYTAERAKKG